MTGPKRAAAIVTGASAGIGADVARRLLDAGETVVNLSAEPPAFSHRDLETIILDLTDRRATEKVAADLSNAFDVTRFVHCAGAVRPARLEEVSLNDLDYLVELHLSCAVTIMKAALPAMRSARFGRVVLISTRGVLGLATRSAYSATKGAMLSLARTWAIELAGAGVTVNVVAPGPIETELFVRHVPDPERRAAIADAVPVNRLGKPEDIGRVVYFLLEPESSFITGQTFFVCGGASLGTLSM